MSPPEQARCDSNQLKVPFEKKPTAGTKFRDLLPITFWGVKCRDGERERKRKRDKKPEWQIG